MKRLDELIRQRVEFDYYTIEYDCDYFIILTSKNGSRIEIINKPLLHPSLSGSVEAIAKGLTHRNSEIYNNTIELLIKLFESANKFNLLRWENEITT